MKYNDSTSDYFHILAVHDRFYLQSLQVIQGRENAVRKRCNFIRRQISKKENRTRSKVCTHDRGQNCPIQTDVARLIRCLSYGKEENFNSFNVTGLLTFFFQTETTLIEKKKKNTMNIFAF